VAKVFFIFSVIFEGESKGSGETNPVWGYLPRYRLYFYHSVRISIVSNKIGAPNQLLDLFLVPM